MVYKIHTRFQNIFSSVSTLKFGMQAGLKKLTEGFDEQFSDWALGRVITYLLSYQKIKSYSGNFQVYWVNFVLFCHGTMATICFPIKTKFSGYIQAILCTT